MNRKTIAQYRQKLQAILAKDDEGQRRTDLLQLAKDVGAGYVHTTLGPTTESPPHKGPMGTIKQTTIHQSPISESELVLNINNALQTETMIDVCNVSARNFWIAVLATMVAMAAATASIISAIKS